MNSLDVEINEICAFCMMSFHCLRYFVVHLDENCKERKKLKEKGIPENGKQRRTIQRKDSLYKHSKRQLDQQLAKVKGTKDEECSVAENTTSYSKGTMKGVSKQATPGLLTPKSHDGGQGDEGSGESGSSIIHPRAIIHRRRLIHK